jgi:CheY-like chemotaxis protein
MAAAATADTATGYRRTQRRVLYAEDSTSSRIVTTAMLKRLGYEVDAVEDGELALQRARHSAYDVILLDIEMPVMDGVTAARSIRALEGHCKDTPILALSAFLADSTETTVWRDAFDCALPKPANSNELQLAMDRALDLRRRASTPNTADHPAALVVKPEKAHAVLSGLRQVLPPGSWRRLVETAAEEMRNALIVIAACSEGGEEDTVRRCAHGLEGLARSFAADEVMASAHTISEVGIVAVTDDRITALFEAIDKWEACPA